MNFVDILGYEMSSEGLSSDIESAWRSIESGTKGTYVACANPHSLVVANHDAKFKTALQGADILLPDGVGIVLAGKVLNRPLRERVAGSEFFTGLTSRAVDRGHLKYFFLGSSEEVLEKLAKRLRIESPHISVCGIYSPPFKNEFSSEENAQMIEAINAAKPDVLWVGMTAPKQEKWIYEHKDVLDVRLIGAIGAVFDFYAGTRKRAPKWICNMGLEWLPRLLREPKRLFRRNVISTPIFLGMLLRAKLSQIFG